MYRLPLALLAGAIACTPVSVFAQDKPATNAQAPDTKDATNPQAPNNKGVTGTQPPEKVGMEKEDQKPKRKKVGGCD